MSRSHELLEPRILFCHLDDFCAGVEQYDQADLRGRPVVVSCRPFPNGEVLSASVEAQALGVRPLLPVKTAYQLCPQAVFLLADFSKYCAVFENILYLYADFTDRIEPAGLGGAFLDISGCPGLGDTVSAVNRLKARLEKEYGLTVSVGVAAGKGVARVASHCWRPNGLTVVPRGQERAFLASLPISYLELDPATEESLELFGLATIGQLASLPLSAVVRKFGPAFAAIHRLANGDDPSHVSVFELPPEVGAEATFDFGLAIDEVAGYLPRLADEVANRLSAGMHGLAPLLGRIVILQLYTRRAPVTLSVALKAHAAEARLILRAAQRLLAEAPLDEPIEGMRLAVADLVPPRLGQLPLLPNREAHLRAIKGAIQGLRRRHGSKTLLRVVYDPTAILTEQTFYLAEVENDEPIVQQTRSRDTKTRLTQQPLLAG